MMMIMCDADILELPLVINVLTTGMMGTHYVNGLSSEKIFDKSCWQCKKNIFGGQFFIINFPSLIHYWESVCNDCMCDAKCVVIILIIGPRSKMTRNFQRMGFVVFFKMGIVDCILTITI